MFLCEENQQTGQVEKQHLDLYYIHRVVTVYYQEHFHADEKKIHAEELKPERYREEHAVSFC